MQRQILPHALTLLGPADSHPHSSCLLQARIITEATYPYRVVFANHAWEDLCGWTAEEVHGKHGLSFLHGEQTSKLRLRRINDAVKYGEVSCSVPRHHTLASLHDLHLPLPDPAAAPARNACMS